MAKKVLVHNCFNPFKEDVPKLCRCPEFKGNWVNHIEAKSRIKMGVAVYVARNTIAVAGRLPRYAWPRMVTPEVIEGAAMGKKRDLAFIAELKLDHDRNKWEDYDLVQYEVKVGKQRRICFFRWPRGRSLKDFNTAPGRSLFHFRSQRTGD